MEVIDILKEASKRVFENVKDLAGTSEAAGDFGRGGIRGARVSCDRQRWRSHGRTHRRRIDRRRARHHDHRTGR